MDKDQPHHVSEPLLPSCALSALWVGVPARYQGLADASRDYQPGREYMAFLQNLPTQPNRAGSQHSLLRSDKSVDDLSSQGESSSVTASRRNALNPDDTCALPDTRRHKKTSSAGRFFETAELSEAAASHEWSRSPRPAKCSHCDTLSILFTLTCTRCGLNWHKNCFPKVTLACGQGSRSPTERRVSMFGVSLQKQLEEQRREIPLILADVVDEIQRRGIQMKGLYRLCGAKSKIEEICELFERHTGDSHIPLDDAHPVNLTSVVKWYLRKLPEPLMTFELHPTWIRFGQKFSSGTVDESQIADLAAAIAQLPKANYETLRFLTLHLNRVSWFSSSNLMTPSNLSTVISPSLCWPQYCKFQMKSQSPTQANSAIQEAQYASKAIEILIANAHSIFNVDRAKDRAEFFMKYPQEEPSLAEDMVGDEEEEKEEECAELDDDSFSVQQPPTPDLLKSARKKNCAPPSECGSEESAVELFPARESGSRDQKGEQYTTCIIVASSAPPTPHPSQQRPVPVRKNVSVGLERSNYACGEVQLNLAEGQYFVPENGLQNTAEHSPAGKSTNSVFDYGNSSGYSTSECSRESESRSSSQRGSKKSTELFPKDKGVSYV
ncbi:unnamed protein product, partial [Mesorhabditis spiculigera]